MQDDNQVLRIINIVLCCIILGWEGFQIGIMVGVPFEGKFLIYLTIPIFIISVMIYHIRNKKDGFGRMPYIIVGACMMIGEIVQTILLVVAINFVITHPGYYIDDPFVLYFTHFAYAAIALYSVVLLFLIAHYATFVLLLNRDAMRAKLSMVNKINAPLYQAPLQRGI